MIAAGQHLQSRAVRSQRALVGALLLLAAVAWMATARLMVGMDEGPGTNPGTLGFFTGTWAAMMAAMMLPSLAPAATAYDRLGGRAGSAGHAGRAGRALFVAGYLALWALAGLCGYAILEAGRAFDGGLLAWAHAGRPSAAGVLALAAAYQFTPRKRTCLARCRSGGGLPPARPRSGAVGALRMGLAHGAWCFGCCWALMAALFALGAMSLAWMVVIAAAIAVEKLLPWPRAGTLAVAALLAALAIGVAASPSTVPGLTVPHAGPAMRGMSMAGR